MRDAPIILRPLPACARRRASWTRRHRGDVALVVVLVMGILALVVTVAEKGSLHFCVGGVAW